MRITSIALLCAILLAIGSSILAISVYRSRSNGLIDLFNLYVDTAGAKGHIASNDQELVEGALLTMCLNAGSLDPEYLEFAYSNVDVSRLSDDGYKLLYQLTRHAWPATRAPLLKRLIRETEREGTVPNHGIAVSRLVTIGETAYSFGKVLPHSEPLACDTERVQALIDLLTAQ